LEKEMKKIIGINGPAGSGKTTFAEYLKYLIKQKDCVIIPFAKPLKELFRLGW
jgi:uridine kinase